MKKLKVNSYLIVLLAVMFFAGCGTRSSQKETLNWGYYYNIGDSLLNTAKKNNISYFAVFNDGTMEQVFNIKDWDKEYESFINVINTSEINMYVNIPYSESGDWNNVLAYVYNKEGVLKVLIRKSSFFNSVCSEGVLSEKQVFANESDRMIEKIHTVYDENNNIVKDTSDCVFNYRFEYPIYFNYSEIPVVQKYGNILK